MFDIPLRNLTDSWFLKNILHKQFSFVVGFFSFLDVTELTPLGRFATVGYRLKKHRFLFEWKLPSPQCGHDDYLTFWHRCDRIMLYRISGAALYIFIKFFLFDIRTLSVKMVFQCLYLNVHSFFSFFVDLKCC